MEPKVIHTAISAANSSSSDWCYAPRSSYAEQSGSGNNWARGHNLYGPKHAEVICELVRHEVHSNTHAQPSCQLLCKVVQVGRWVHYFVATLTGSNMQFRCIHA